MEIILTHYSRSLRTIEPNFICVEDIGTYLRTEILRIGETDKTLEVNASTTEPICNSFATFGFMGDRSRR